MDNNVSNAFLWFITNILNNKILMISVFSWMTAGIIKVLVNLIITKKINLLLIMSSGGMPSSHTATVVSLLLSVGMYRGLDTAEFAIASIFAIVVIHDAMGVRFETGKQAKILNQIIFDTNIFSDINEEKLKEYVGHTPLQTLCGAIVGILVFIFMTNIINV